MLRRPLLPLLVLVLAGCGRAEPRWISAPNEDPTTGGLVLGAMGSAPKSGLGQQMQTDKALQIARGRLAALIETNVQTAIKVWQQETVDISKANGDNSSVKDLTENVSRGVAAQTLKGAIPKARYVDESTGELYVWVVIEPALAEQAGQVAAGQAKAWLGSHSTYSLKAEADKAFAELDRLVDEQLKNQKVSNPPAKSSKL